MTNKKKLIEVALPLEAISRASAREKSIRHGHPSTLHLWWARRPLAAARAVLWASLVDDPSAHPDRFPTKANQAKERSRLFDILKQLVVWKNSNDPQVLKRARDEINESCNGELPNVLDPFCGGGAIPLEAGRLGLPVFGGDLNPVAVLISKGLVEIPQRFAGSPPVNPDTNGDLGVRIWDRGQGLAKDVGYYGRWIRDRAFQRIGHLYPKVRLPSSQGGREAAVIAWLWARTVESPDPSWNGHVPLVRSWVLRKAKKNKPAMWVEPTVDRARQTITYGIREGDGFPRRGTVDRRGGTCLATGSPIGFPHIREQGRRGLLGRAQIAVAVEGHRGRVYQPPVGQPAVPEPSWTPTSPLPQRTLGFRVQQYGMMKWVDLFTDRQIVALSTFSDVLGEVRSVVEADARAAEMVDDGVRLRDGGAGATAYADAVVTYLAFVVDKCADYWSAICSWHNGRELITHTFGRQAIPMVWDYAEANPFSGSSGSWLGQVAWVQKAVAAIPGCGIGEVLQRDAVSRVREVPRPVVCTDPPYYDNISYADLSDFFYGWLRRNVADVWPEETATLLSPKVEELIANPYRAGSKQAAKEHFEGGMVNFLHQVARSHHSQYPATIFYAYKQQETKEGDRTSTGWETFLQGLTDAGLQVTATWPIRTELSNRPIGQTGAALASSIVITFRPRPVDAPVSTRSELLAALRMELPEAQRLLRRQSILPVDMAQSMIGPGMAVFSRYSRVLEADGSTMSVRQAMVMINHVLEEIRSEEETEFDADTQWALTWYQQYGMAAGPFGDAETLSKAKITSVAGVAQAGIVVLGTGKVRLKSRRDFDRDWDPRADRRLTAWVVTQQLAARLDQGSEERAADLLTLLDGTVKDQAIQLAHLLYLIAEDNRWSEDAVAYNMLVSAWPAITELAAGKPERGQQQVAFGGLG